MNGGVKNVTRIRFKGTIDGYHKSFTRFGLTKEEAKRELKEQGVKNLSLIEECTIHTNAYAVDFLDGDVQRVIMYGNRPVEALNSTKWGLLPILDINGLTEHL